ncbi:MAG: PAS domain S-box protein, partial [Pedobacter sp.]
HIRDNANTSRLPVIFLSARAGEESRIDGLEAGADDYLVKPFSAAELLTKIRAQIKISKTRDHAEQQLRSLLTNAPVAIGIYRGANHVVEMANQRMLNYWGRSAEETFGYPLLEVITEFGEQGFGKVMDDVYQTGERFVSEEIPIQINRLGIEEISYVHVTMEALRNEDQQITGIMAVAADVTEQTTVLRQLEKANDTLKLAMEAANMGIWRTDWGTDNLMVSDIARAIHAIPKEKVLSFDETLEVIIPEHRDLFLQAIKNAVESKGHFNEDYQVQPFDGSKKKWINSTGKVELDDSGEVTGVIGTIMDITESVEDGQRKDDFIGMVSHELKTPLTTVNGYVQLLKLQAQKNNDDSSREKLDRVLAQVKKMSSLIGGFLNVSRLEAGKIHLNKKPFELTALIREVIFDEESSTQTHQLIFEPEEEIQVIADRDKVGSAITNLISNAVKYSPKGTKVETTCVVNGDSVTISVRDEGMGVKPEEQAKLFERYYRTENHQMANISGFGIGLYLSAEIIRRHHGKIWVESEPGKGSVFFIQLPLV